jgi:hypothetical protein
VKLTGSLAVLPSLFQACRLAFVEVTERVAEPF